MGFNGTVTATVIATSSAHLPMTPSMPLLILGRKLDVGHTNAKV